MVFGQMNRMAKIQLGSTFQCGDTNTERNRIGLEPQTINSAHQLTLQTGSPAVQGHSEGAPPTSSSSGSSSDGVEGALLWSAHSTVNTTQPVGTHLVDKPVGVEGGGGGGEGGRGDGVRGGSEWRELLYTYAKASRVSGVYIISQ